MTKTIYLICGVPGSGKTWACERVHEDYAYLPHDEYYHQDAVTMIALAARNATKPVLTECPFGEREVKSRLEAMGFEVVPVFVIEEPKVIAMRYQMREGKVLPKAHATRAVSIKDRAIEWAAHHGTSEEVLDFLRREVNHG